MLANLLITTIAVLALLGGGIAVQAAGRRQAQRHPEIGPYREAGCGGLCGGCGTQCETAGPSPAEVPARMSGVKELR